MKRPWFRSQSVHPPGLAFTFLRCSHRECPHTFAEEGHRYGNPQELRQAAWEKGWSQKYGKDFCPQHPPSKMNT